MPQAWPPLVKAVGVEPLDGFNVLVTFRTGEERIINLDRYLYGPVFEPVRQDPMLFRAITVQRGALTWPNEADIDPLVLYYDLVPAGMEKAPAFQTSTTLDNSPAISFPILLRVIANLSLSEKAMLMSIISQDMADEVEQSEEPATLLKVAEAQAPYRTGSKTN